MSLPDLAISFGFNLLDQASLVRFLRFTAGGNATAARQRQVWTRAPSWRSHKSGLRDRVVFLAALLSPRRYPRMIPRSQHFGDKVRAPLSIPEVGYIVRVFGEGRFHTTPPPRSRSRPLRREGQPNASVKDGERRHLLAGPPERTMSASDNLVRSRGGASKQAFVKSPLEPPALGMMGRRGALGEFSRMRCWVMGLPRGVMARMGPFYPTPPPWGRGSEGWGLGACGGRATFDRRTPIPNPLTLRISFASPQGKGLLGRCPKPAPHVALEHHPPPAACGAYSSTVRCLSGGQSRGSATVSQGPLWPSASARPRQRNAETARETSRDRA